MTRDEAIERISNITIRGADINLSNYNAHFINVHIARDFLRKIYNDVESRTCSNCNFYQNEVCCNSDSLLCTEFTTADFGCIEFERTKND